MPTWLIVLSHCQLIYSIQHKLQLHFGFSQKIKVMDDSEIGEEKHFLSTRIILDTLQTVSIENWQMKRLNALHLLTIIGKENRLHTLIFLVFVNLPLWQ